MRTIKILILSLCSLFVVIIANSQVTDPSIFFKSSEDKVNYSEITEEIKKGDLFFEKASNEKSSSKKYKLLKKASKVYDIAYRKQYEIFASYTHKYAQTSAEEKKRKIRELNYMASDKFGSAVSLRRAAVSAKTTEAIKLYKKAHEYDTETKNIQLMTFGVYHEKNDYTLSNDNPFVLASVENRKEYSQKEFSESKFSIIQKQGNNLPQEKVKPHEKISVDFSNSEILYSVQIGASKRPIKTEYFTERYSVTEKIKEEYIGGMYRYTFGSYKTYSEATGIKEKCNVTNAFVVAYYKNKRLKHVTHVLVSEKDKQYENERETLTYNSNKSGTLQHSNQNPTETEYRIQIGVSILPAHPNQLKQMNPTSLPTKAWKSPNYYKYTIGSFKTFAEAKNFKNANGLKNSFIVKYKNGQQIK